MKAITFVNNEIKQQEVSMNFLPFHWARLRVSKAGLCGSDITKFVNKNFSKGHTEILGHEFFGQIIEINGLSHNFSINDFVVAIPLLSCKKCLACLNHQENLCVEGQSIGRTIYGAFAEFVNVPLINLIKIADEDISDSYVLTDPLAVCIHAINLVCFTAFERCLVIGDGVIGCLLAWLLQKKGHDVWIKGIHKENVQFIKKFGIKNLEDDLLDNFDVIFETVGRAQSDTLNACLKKVRSGGKVIVIGVFILDYLYSFVPRDFFIKEVELIGSNSYVQSEFEEAFSLIKLDQQILSMFISHSFPFSKFNDALVLARDKKKFTMKIIIDMDKKIF